MAVLCRWRGLTLGLFCVVAAGLTDRTHSQVVGSCHDVTRRYSALNGMSKKDVPHTPISGEHLKICPVGQTCCTADMESKLSKHSRHEYEKHVNRKTALLKQVYATHATKFNDFFMQKLEDGKKRLHLMFSSTYGVRYKQNAKVFINLFAALSDYYRGRGINLLDSLDRFFTTLLQRMFELMNDGYEFTPRYLNCVSEQMDTLKPFGDAPQKIGAQLKRAFIAARTFTQGLAIGREVLNSAPKFQIEASCRNAVMRMRYCPYCRGIPDIKPCHNYCMNVMKGCLAYHSDLNTPWNDYLENLLKVADKLQGPFNYESVVTPIGLKISDAIMAFQENGNILTEKIFKGCGQPERKGRKKRDAPFSAVFQPTPDKDTAAAHQPSLGQMVKVLRNAIKGDKDFWIHLPKAVCHDSKMSAAVSEPDNCWNGDKQGRYQPGVVGDGRLAQNNNPEVDVDLKKKYALIEKHILKLKTMSGKLQSANNGIDVEPMLIDYSDDDTVDAGSGSGSGSGSGWGDPDTPKSNGGRGVSTIEDIYIPEPTVRYSVRPNPQDATRKTSSAATSSVTYTMLLLPLFLHTVCQAIV